MIIHSSMLQERRQTFAVGFWKHESGKRSDESDSVDSRKCDLSTKLKKSTYQLALKAGGPLNAVGEENLKRSFRI